MECLPSQVEYLHFVEWGFAGEDRPVQAGKAVNGDELGVSPALLEPATSKAP